MSVGPELPAARDVSLEAPVFFLHFPEEEGALEAAVALLHRGYRVEITPPRPELAQWDVHVAGSPNAVSVDEAAEILMLWAGSLGGGYSGYQLGADIDFGEDADLHDGVWE